MIKLLRLINPLHALRLEREIASLRKQHDTMRADVVTYADIVGRGLDPRGDAGLLRRAILAEKDRDVARLVIHHALKDMRNGRLDAARAGLEAILGEAHAEPAPIHVVNKVA